MSFEDVVLSDADGIGIIRISRPQANNAIRPRTLQEICRAVDQLNGDAEVRAIILCAEGKHFSVGADLDRLTTLPDRASSEGRTGIYEDAQGAMRRLFYSPKPTLAAVNGAAVTLGCELALACDFRIASDTAQFREAWVLVGAMPPLGGLFLLPRYIGLGRATEMCLAGIPLNADAAREAGLVSNVVPSDQLDATALEFAQRLAALPPLACSAIKDGLRRSHTSTMENEWSSNVPAQVMLFQSQDFAEGVAAAKERRPPKFNGR